MSYSGRKRYKSRREKNKLAAGRAKMIALFILIAGLIFLFINRVSIYDYVSTYFY